MASQAAAILKRYFGYDEFREGQAELIDSIVGGRDALGVMPTGAGKSLCYQVPAMLLPGAALVISPLISLMRDQVQALVANGVPAAFVNSSLNDAQWGRAMSNARAGQYKIIYVAPERLLAPSMLELARSLRVSLIAVDEAHCISQWGQDFRPSYSDIPKFVEALPARPVVAAFTATATPRVRDDILEKLGLRNPRVLMTGFDRPNLYFEVQQPKDKNAALAQFLKENGVVGENGGSGGRSDGSGGDSDSGVGGGSGGDSVGGNSGGSGIVYCSTRKETESVAEWLQAGGFSAARYHAGLSDGERSQSQDDFLCDRVQIIVATNAFGMGIDKSNVRFVVHYNMPQNVESYYQEAGRAGRDGLPGKCLLLYARKDISTALFLINKSDSPDEIARNRQLLKHMERYCETDGCLRRYMLRYFGENAEEDCGNCGNCLGSFDEIDATVDAQKVLSHIARLNRAGKRFMFSHVADILLGKSDDFTDLPTFGLMRGADRGYIRSLVNRLAALGYICGGDYLSTEPKASEVLFGGARVAVRASRREAYAKAGRTARKAGEPRYAVSEGLLARLKELRLEIAREEKVPAFAIFSDATLVDMCQKRPRDEDEMLSVSGVGSVKLERWGERFLQLLREAGPGAAAREAPQALTPELFRSQAGIEDSPLQITRVADNFNAVLIRHGRPTVSGMKLNSMMVEAGYLEVADGVKLPTQSGKELGITAVERHSARGSYTQCLFGADAQRACLELAIAELALSGEAE